jgi:hypothetical protein
MTLTAMARGQFLQSEVAVTVAAFWRLGLRVVSGRGRLLALHAATRIFYLDQGMMTGTIVGVPVATDLIS